MTKNKLKITDYSDYLVMQYFTDKQQYTSSDRHTFAREHGKTPNGNNLFGQWVFRSPDGNFIDFDTYRSALAERNKITLIK